MDKGPNRQTEKQVDDIYGWTLTLSRTSHDAWVIARACAITCANQEKGGLGRQSKAHLKVSCVGWYCPCKILNSYSWIHFNQLSRIHLKLILLTLPFKPLFLRQILTAATFCYYNHGHNIMRIFDVLPHFPFTTSETKPDY